LFSYSFHEGCQIRYRTRQTVMSTDRWAPIGRIRPPPAIPVLVAMGYIRPCRFLCHIPCTFEIEGFDDSLADRFCVMLSGNLGQNEARQEIACIRIGCFCVGLK